MFLKSLTIEKNNLVVREIVFKKGLNLIVDETKGLDKKESGNSVGKTTVIRLVDFCLGGDGKNIYTDQEFKTKSNNSLIEKFLKTENVVITLKIIEDIDNVNSPEIIIRKNFVLGKEKIQEINGEQYINNKDFDAKLKELIFNSTDDKPTFRQIIAKNVRDEKNRLINTIQVLNSFATKDVYEALYLFWLGIDVDSIGDKQALQQQRKFEEKIQKRLRNSGALTQIVQSLEVVNRTIDSLEKRKNSLNADENFNSDFNNLSSVKSEVNRLTSEIGGLEMRKELILESKEELETDFVNIDTDQIKQIYSKTKRFIPDLQSTFEDALKFHSDMLREKISFITQELPEVENNLTALKNKLSSLLFKQKELSTKFNKTEGFESLQEIILELNKAFEKRGELSELKRLWDESNKQLSKVNDELDNINEKISSKDDLINERIKEFNKYFSVLSYKLYGEQFVLSPDKNDDVYELNISSIEGNVGTGKKKGQIAAFDFAYIQFADSLGIKCLHFLLHDQIENIHDNQISSILTDIVGGINCQYIVPVLRDKLPDDIDTSQYEILKLSQRDKLFRIE